LNIDGACTDSTPFHVRDGIRMMRERMHARILPGKEQVRQTISELDPLLQGEPEHSSMYAPFASIPKLGFDRSRTQQKAITLIRDRVRPALRELRDFLVNEYIGACPESISVMEWPNGAEVFREYVRISTGANLEPESIHTFGLQEVARVRAAMAATLAKAGFHGTLDEFLSRTRSDPRFYFTSTDELLDAYRAVAVRIEPLIRRLIHRSPGTRVQVAPSAHAMTAAAQYHVPSGTVLVDVKGMKLWPRFEVTAVMLHEGLPGHHLQAVFARGRSNMRLRQSEAFTEGWALYAEGLGAELGMYTDPYDELGRLSMDLTRAVRAVFDTGIHAHGWTVTKAKHYLMAQTGKSQAIAELEVGRAKRPAALLAYKVGEQRFKALRTRVAGVLGSRFDVRSFHEAMLRWGPLPLDILDRKVAECLDDPDCSSVFSNTGR